MAQTLSEKLRILADANEAGEDFVNTEWLSANESPISTINYSMSNIYCIDSISRIPPKPTTIKVGNREINAPLLVMPKIGDKYWYVNFGGVIIGDNWDSVYYEVTTFNNANCWATEADARAYAEASLAVRKGDIK